MHQKHFNRCVFRFPCRFIDSIERHILTRPEQSPPIARRPGFLLRAAWWCTQCWYKRAMNSGSISSALRIWYCRSSMPLKQLLAGRASVTMKCNFRPMFLAALCKLDPPKNSEEPSLQKQDHLRTRSATVAALARGNTWPGTCTETSEVHRQVIGRLTDTSCWVIGWIRPVGLTATIYNNPSLTVCICLKNTIQIKIDSRYRFQRFCTFNPVSSNRKLLQHSQQWDVHFVGATILLLVAIRQTLLHSRRLNLGVAIGRLKFDRFKEILARKDTE